MTSSTKSELPKSIRVTSAASGAGLAVMNGVNGVVGGGDGEGFGSDGDGLGIGKADGEGLGSIW